MKILALIPARMGSTRFPGKPLALIDGQPMLKHVYDNVLASSLLTHVAVATCDEIIASYINSIGGNSVMTSSHHDRASDRCAEALLKLEYLHNTIYDVVIMVQGDEPMVTPSMIDESLKPLFLNPDIDVVNLYSQISSEQADDLNTIKVVINNNSNALYFSRQKIPSSSSADTLFLKQVCIIPFRRNSLLEYVSLPPTPLEKLESVDMLRFLENDKVVHMVGTSEVTHAVDTPEDIAAVENMLRARA